MRKNNTHRFTITDYILRNLRNNRLRTNLTIGGIAICVALFILFNSIGDGLNLYISQRLSETRIQKYGEMAVLLEGWLNVLNTIFIVILAVAVANTMLISVSERQREYGTLKALGFTRRQIRELILFEAMSLTGIAFIVGTGVGIVLSLTCNHLFWLSSGGSGGIGWFFAPAHITAATLLFAAFISIVVGTLAALYPAVRAAGLRPAEALRYE